MRYAIISDVHSNLEALECAWAEIQKRKVDHVICLGDVVGYGADPARTLALVSEISDEIIMGNHDRAIDDHQLRDHFTEWARVAIEWTACVLTPLEKKLLCRFPPLVIDHKANVTWTHGSAHETDQFHYIFSSAEASRSFRVLETDFCFFGHTHVPSLFSKRAGEAQYLPAGVYQLNRGEQYLVNPGSLGQPRDHNPRLSFSVFDSDRLVLEIVRLDYDNQKAAQKIRQAGLPGSLADRLL